MSTRCSLGYKEIQNKPTKIHIFRETLDDKFYLEVNDCLVELPEEIAIEFAKVLEKI